jgi:hypothetical protein
MKNNEKDKILYKKLKPLVDDFSKPCRKEERKLTDDEIRIKFQKEKEFNIDDFITSTFKKELLCLVCKSLFRNPLTCYKCNTPFCEPCITEQLNLHSKCPKCFANIFLEMMQPATQDFLKAYNENYKCPFQGCIDKFLLKDLKEHLENCLFKFKHSGYCDKLIYMDNAKDPYMKTYVYDYMTGLSFNKPCGSSIDLISVGGVKRVDFKDDITKLADLYRKTIIDLQERTKKTNEKLKKNIK